MLDTLYVEINHPVRRGKHIRFIFRRESWCVFKLGKVRVTRRGPWSCEGYYIPELDEVL